MGEHKRSLTNILNFIIFPYKGSKNAVFKRKESSFKLKYTHIYIIIFQNFGWNVKFQTMPQNFPTIFKYFWGGIFEWNIFLLIMYKTYHFQYVFWLDKAKRVSEEKKRYKLLIITFMIIAISRIRIRYIVIWFSNLGKYHSFK